MGIYSVFDIGGTNVKYSVMDEDGLVQESGKLPTPSQGEGEIFQLLIDIVKRQKEQFPIEGIALSLPGAVDIQTGHVYFAGQVTDLMGKSVKEELKVLGLPVELENDANCAALAEKWKGNAIEQRHFICLTVGTGIGGAIVINNEIFHGRMGMAGEIGLMLLDANRPQGELMNGKTLSRMGSTWNLVHRISRSLGESLTGEEVFHLYKKGEKKLIISEVDTFFNALAIGTVNLIHTLAPEKILFGGGISEQTGFIDEIKERVKMIRAEALDLTSLDTCKFGNQSGQIGALYHFLRQTRTDL